MSYRESFQSAAAGAGSILIPSTIIGIMFTTMHLTGMKTLGSQGAFAMALGLFAAAMAGVGCGFSRWNKSKLAFTGAALAAATAVGAVAYNYRDVLIRTPEEVSATSMPVSVALQNKPELTIQPS